MINDFSEKALQALNGCYVYALIDPRNNQVFYIGKGSNDRVFNHELESRAYNLDKAKLNTIREIEQKGLAVKKLIINWGLTEAEAIASEASLINLLNYVSRDKLTNIVSGHHVHEGLTVEEFERNYGAKCLTMADIKHNILVIKINKLYKRGMTEKELYEAVRGFWRASIENIKYNKIEYVFGVYNQLVVAVYKPDEWHYVYEMIDPPRLDELENGAYEKVKNRIYFISKNYDRIDENQQFYLHKSIAELKVNQSAQNPITYLLKN